MLNSIDININPIDYVTYKEKEVTIDNITAPISKVEKIDDKLYIVTRRFDSRDTSEILPPIRKEVTLNKLKSERAFVIDYLDKLNILIEDLENLKVDGNNNLKRSF